MSETQPNKERDGGFVIDESTPPTERELLERGYEGAPLTEMGRIGWHLVAEEWARLNDAYKAGREAVIL